MRFGPSFAANFGQGRRNLVRQNFHNHAAVIVLADALAVTGFAAQQDNRVFLQAVAEVFKHLSGNIVQATVPLMSSRLKNAIGSPDFFDVNGLMLVTIPPNVTSCRSPISAKIADADGAALLKGRVGYVCSGWSEIYRPSRSRSKPSS